MNLEGRRIIAADRATVWAHLSSVETLKASIPGWEELTYMVRASVGSKIAQPGSRLIAGFAHKMTDQFFEQYQGVVAGTDIAD